MSDDKSYRECMAEIDAVLKKWDMAAAVTVISKTRAMFKYTFPKWACISIENDELRVRSKRADYPSREAQQETLEQSVHVILQMRDIAAQTFAMCDAIEKRLKESIEIEHKPFHDFDPERSH
jgi:hypothetical protein